MIELGKGVSREKYLRLVCREFQRREEELQKELSVNFSPEVREETRDRGDGRSEFYRWV